MRSNVVKFSMFVAALFVVAVALAAEGDAIAPAPCADGAAPVAIAENLSQAQPAAEPSADGASTKCCDPALEPGVGGNPLCFEGHTCCANGQWSCNNADGTPGCQACSSTCALTGATCSANAECCSGVCKGNHKCR